mmetsp:Transcript_11048/g.18890  ORF Transcript_11048/g.18890 Transcript_11048/m.18890 type:complete len:119 (+) Transcript_11048:126-482(+)|eukprot:CAMPEP_0184695498 /NCGR_PEP_ID=MMETSP0313-20130426/3104_1 /TAXON_ID=2792 /ORGANISM="Porphyridium aerugineum, Strain SAG 1380-2" /LENGTH=118 /DNA_ID=CAMNT_0027153963 /DNA_START=124 /DNA_END=480 /DNA_ORIENTATION=+
MESAFVSVAPISTSAFLGEQAQAVSAPRAASTITMMANRRNLKREKVIRNMAFARSHRAQTGNLRVNRRQVNRENKESDDLYLSSVFTTITFGGEAENANSYENNKFSGARRGPRRDN